MEHRARQGRGGHRHLQLGSWFLFLQEQIKDIIIKTTCNAVGGDAAYTLLKRRCLGESTKTNKTSEFPPPSLSSRWVAGAAARSTVFFWEVLDAQAIFFRLLCTIISAAAKKKIGV